MLEDDAWLFKGAPPMLTRRPHDAAHEIDVAQRQGHASDVLRPANAPSSTAGRIPSGMASCSPTPAA